LDIPAEVYESLKRCHLHPSHNIRADGTCKRNDACREKDDPECPQIKFREVKKRMMKRKTKAIEGTKPEAKVEQKSKEAPKIPHVGVDFTMPTLEQVAVYVKAEAAKGTKTLTATQIREHFKVPGKIPMNTRMKQLEKAGFGTFAKVEKSNTLTIDAGAITSGKAVIAAKQPKAKKEEKTKQAENAEPTAV
jgi:hypothetical protein